MNKEEKLAVILDHLKAKEQSISFAESCTGGLIASAFTSIAGISAIFRGSCVTYSNAIKEAWLGVKEETLIAHGAVSRACVGEMVEGVSSMAKSDYAIAVSGIAGPDGGSEHKPVGTVYIAIKTPKRVEIFHCLFEGDRHRVQEQSVDFAIDNLVDLLEK
jgi:nicotinamide-nucleotide amidase